MKLSEKRNIALVLSGGGIKAAAFHIGVCLALQEKGFHFLGGTLGNEESQDHKLTVRMYVGSSAGALVSAILAAGYGVESLVEAFEMGTSFNSRRRRNRTWLELKPLTYRDIFSLNRTSLMSFLPSILGGRKQSMIVGGIEAFIKSGFKLNGLFTMQGLERYLRDFVLPTNDFRELRAKLFITATQLNHSRKVIFGSFNENHKDEAIQWANFATISQAVAASASLPPVFAPYGIQNEKGKEIYFFDGEIRDTLSTHIAADNGADLVIASYSIQPYHYKEKTGSLHNYGIPVILNQALYQAVEQKIIRATQHQKDLRSVIATVDGYFKQQNLPEEHRERLLKVLFQKSGVNPETDYIYIHPDAGETEMFFADHFSLNKDSLSHIVKTGFRSALKTLRHYNM